MMVAKDDEVLSCQLYPAMPLGSLTADHEMVNGEVVLAPEAGEINEGAGGVAAKAEAAKSIRTHIDTNARFKRAFIFASPGFKRERTIQARARMIQPVPWAKLQLIFRCSRTLKCLQSDKHREHCLDNRRMRAEQISSTGCDIDQMSSASLSQRTRWKHGALDGHNRRTSAQKISEDWNSTSRKK
jgi:hypothetical protein